MALTHLAHVEGATEPHIVEVVCALVAANDCHRVLETGGFLGHSSICLAQALARLGWQAKDLRELIVAEIDPKRAVTVEQAIETESPFFFPEGTYLGSYPDDRFPYLTWRVIADDVLKVIGLQADESLDAVWIDDDHTPAHVAGEVQALLPKMRTNGLLLFHDVYGVCDLQAVVKQYGGYSLDLPRWGPAGGLGIIQVR